MGEGAPKHPGTNAPRTRTPNSPTPKIPWIKFAFPFPCRPRASSPSRFAGAGPSRARPPARRSERPKEVEEPHWELRSRSRKNHEPRIRKPLDSHPARRRHSSAGSRCGTFSPRAMLTIEKILNQVQVRVWRLFCGALSTVTLWALRTQNPGGKSLRSRRSKSPKSRSLSEPGSVDVESSRRRQSRIAMLEMTCWAFGILSSPPHRKKET